MFSLKDYNDNYLNNIQKEAKFFQDLGDINLSELEDVVLDRPLHIRKHSFWDSLVPSFFTGIDASARETLQAAHRVWDYLRLNSDDNEADLRQEKVIQGIQTAWNLIQKQLEPDYLRKESTNYHKRLGEVFHEIKKALENGDNTDRDWKEVREVLTHFSFPDNYDTVVQVQLRDFLKAAQALNDEFQASEEMSFEEKDQWMLFWNQLFNNAISSSLQVIESRSPSQANLSIEDPDSDRPFLVQLYRNSDQINEGQLTFSACIKRAKTDLEGSISVLVEHKTFSLMPSENGGVSLVQIQPESDKKWEIPMRKGQTLESQILETIRSKVLVN